MSYFKTVRVQDGSGNAITSTASALDVNLKSGGITTVTANLGTIADVATQTTLAAINTKLVTGTDIGDVTINNTSGASAVNIQDGGNTITVDGTLTANLGTISDVATQTTLSAINSKLVTGTDIGDVTINNASGASAVNIQDGGNSITVDTTAVVPGTAATNLGKAEDAAHATGDVGVMVLAVRLDSDSGGFVGANGDYSPLAVNNNGFLKVMDLSTIGYGTGVINYGVASFGFDGSNAYPLNIDAEGQLQVDVLTLPSLIAGNAVIGQVKITDGTTVVGVHGDGGIQTTLLPVSKSDSVEKFFLSVATGIQTAQVIDSAVTNRAVKEIFVGGQGFEAGAYVTFKRGATTIGDIYLSATNFLSKDKLDFGTDTLTCDINTGNAGTMTVYFVVKYFK